MARAEAVLGTLRAGRAKMRNVVVHMFRSLETQAMHQWVMYVGAEREAEAVWGRRLFRKLLSRRSSRRLVWV